MKFNFLRLIGLNVSVLKDYMTKNGFECIDRQEDGDFAFYEFKSSPIVYHIHVKCRIESMGDFVDSFTVW